MVVGHMATQSSIGWKQAPCLAICILVSRSCAWKAGSSWQLLDAVINDRAELLRKSPTTGSLKSTGSYSSAQACPMKERGVGQPYCERPCEGYQHGKLPKLKIVRRLGFGSFGSVSLAKMENGKEVTIKMAVHLSADERMRAQEEKTLRNEALQYKHLKGIPGILDLIYAGPFPEQNVDMVIIMEKADISLHDYVEYWKSLRRPKEQRWPQFKELATVARDVLKIIQQVHKKGYLHRDIKAENLMFKEGKLYLIDLGNTCPVGQDVCNAQGSPITISANSWRGLQQNVRDDLESVLNLVVYLSGQHTWDECLEPSRYLNLTRLAAQNALLNCLSEKKVAYLEDPRACGVTGLDDLARMIRSFDPASGKLFEYDKAIKLLSNYGPLTFPTQDQLDAERGVEAAEKGKKPSTSDSKKSSSSVPTKSSPSASTSSDWTSMKSSISTGSDHSPPSDETSEGLGLSDQEMDIFKFESFSDMAGAISVHWAGVYDNSSGGTATIEQPGATGKIENVSISHTRYHGTRMNATVNGETIAVYQEATPDGNVSEISPANTGTFSDGVIKWKAGNTWKLRVSKLKHMSESEHDESDAPLKPLSEATKEQVHQMLSSAVEIAQEKDTLTQMEKAILGARDDLANLRHQIYEIWDKILSAILLHKGFKEVKAAEFFKSDDLLKKLPDDKPGWKKLFEDFRKIPESDKSGLIAVARLSSLKSGEAEKLKAVKPKAA